VIEVTFEEVVALPAAATELRLGADAGWRPLAALDAEAQAPTPIQ
jgi:hypothetical protein